ncbi:MAG: hypothetical protein GY947_17850 [Rhodobacteraceae bacterium]|nr:hypothetical protein [Paracoccaceae bacterium]
MRGLRDGMSHVTAADLDAALPEILAAPKQGKIEILCRRPDFSQRDFRPTLRLTVAGGIENERWLKHPWLTLPDGSPDPRIQVSILSLRMLDMCWRDRDNVIYPGDTIITDMDLAEENLPVGQRLLVGGAVLEVSDKFNNACAKWKKRHGRASYDWINRPEFRRYRLRGVLCKIVQDGVICKGDQLVKL